MKLIKSESQNLQKTQDRVPVEFDSKDNDIQTNIRALSITNKFFIPMM